MPLHFLIWLFPIVIALHNLEEALWFPAWAKRSDRWHAQFTPGSFRFAALVLTASAFLITGLSVASGKQSIWTFIAFGYAAAMLANVVVPHVVVSVATREYMPGLGTGLLLNLPVLSFLLVKAFRDGYVSGWKAAEYSVGVAAVLLLSIPALFYIGKAMRL
jgi:hypothetical protein